MRVLWVTNVLGVDAGEMLGLRATPSGGWLEGALRALGGRPGVDITVTAPGPVVEPISLGTRGRVGHIAFPGVTRRGAKGSGREWARAVIERERPDLVHIHGTELPHSWSFAVACREQRIPCVISIQGLLSVYAKHVRGTLPWRVVCGVASRPWVRANSVEGLRRSFVDQGRLEIETLNAVNHVIGRTAWDRACTAAINPDRIYHHCDETLRAAFYETPKWRPSADSSILIAQGHYPIKGLHLLLEALPAVLQRHPETRLIVAGISPLVPPVTSYGRYVAHLIAKHQLQDVVQFTGALDATCMAERLARSSVLVCPSTIENSPNSVCEAMLVGTPVVAAYVGGIPDLVTQRQDGLLYQGDAPYMLAHALLEVFEDPDRAAAMAALGVERARRRHDPQRNADRTMEIYDQVIDAESDG